MDMQEKLYEEIKKNNYDNVQSLLSNKEVNAAEYNNWAIQLASQNGFLEIIHLLSSDPNVSLQGFSNNPLGCATGGGHFESVKFFLNDSRVDPTHDHNHALLIAYRAKKNDILWLLWNNEKVKLFAKESTPNIYNELLKKNLGFKLKEFNY
jgi:hypothetical protein